MNALYILFVVWAGADGKPATLTVPMETFELCQAAQKQVVVTSGRVSTWCIRTDGK